MSKSLAELLPRFSNKTLLESFLRMPVVKRQTLIEIKFLHSSPLKLEPVRKKGDIRIFKIKCRYYADKMRVNDVM